MSTQTVIYADHLLLVNFSMDFLALYLTSRLCNYPIRKLRMTIAALIGSFSALVSTVIGTYKADISPLLCIAFLTITALIITAVAFGKRFVPRTALSFIAVSMGLGGCMTAIYTIADNFGINKNNVYSQTDDNGSKSPVIFLIIAAISGAVSLIYTKIRKIQVQRTEVNVSMTAFGTETEFPLFCDSGALLCDPFQNKPVIILSADYFKDKLPHEILEAARSPDSISTLSGDYAHSVRLIPASGVLGSGLLIGFIPEKLEADGSLIDAVVAIDAAHNEYCGCAGIIPLSLITRC